uniref:C2H2-type domain-containing protein n=1 Tax=Ditylenchus dipsaci TaxID=166011 RepID=A0A915D215_9BILA
MMVTEELRLSSAQNVLFTVILTANCGTTTKTQEGVQICMQQVQLQRWFHPMPWRTHDLAPTELSASKKSPLINGEECDTKSVEVATLQISEKSQSLERDKLEVKPEIVAKNAPVLRKSATALGLNTEKCCNLAIEIPPTHVDLMDRIRSLSATEGQDCDACSSSSLSSVLRCKECPFECSDTILEKLHADMHKKARRPFQCNMCSFNCFSAESLHSHLSLHAPPLSPISAIQMRKRLATRRRNECSNQMQRHCL